MSNVIKIPTNQELYLIFKQFVIDQFEEVLKKYFPYMTDAQRQKISHCGAEAMVAKPDPETFPVGFREREKVEMAKAAAAFRKAVNEVTDTQGEEFDEDDYYTQIDDVCGEVFIELRVQKQFKMRELIGDQMKLAGEDGSINPVSDTNGRWRRNTFK